MSDFDATPIRAPLFIVGIGGALRSGSSTDMALRVALAAAARSGAETLLLSGEDLHLPMYAPEQAGRTPQAAALVEALRRADGVVIGSPSYHGGISGLVKNSLDYAEDLRADARPYLDGRAVGAITTGAGWQAGVATLAALRGVVHALRGWNTPLGVVINTAEPAFDSAGQCREPRVRDMLEIMAGQVMTFAASFRGAAVPRSSS